MFRLLHPFVEVIQPFLIPLCFCLAWGLTLLVAWSVGSAIASGVSQAKRMHQIPCTGCVFFTNDHRLKCPVRPKVAMTEEAIGCMDYREH
ncbi:hypothetical protein JJD41_20495 [Oxynema sp. CENA135]|uniref:Uncharacterized protein n=1 Tax=Oxynema aestuarii AP17 TaxID=2064643 RepID=A0A6H1TZX9_9CYAN|nr:hypothetical protein [Oxynema aestuarii]MBK4732228.1 hypothetical protein [Oxynema sp. CENA135]QIZ71746.1 hypothetical protein HCG48_15090 [Oxynema aestuarii AP17]RMH76815.1 MAG: hypothetical protein D6680_07365 [Cyanobacteria bacterium J007]